MRGNRDWETSLQLPATVCRQRLGTQETGNHNNCPKFHCFPPGLGMFIVIPRQCFFCHRLTKFRQAKPIVASFFLCLASNDIYLLRTRPSVLCLIFESRYAMISSVLCSYLHNEITCSLFVTFLIMVHPETCVFIPT